MLSTLFTGPTLLASLLLLSAPLDPISSGPVSSGLGSFQQGDETPAQEAQPINSEKRARYREFFSIADYDGNGWISYREGRESLNFDRLTYAGFDSDQDGRIRPGEFETRMLLLEERAGGFEAPKRSEGPQLLPTRNSEQLRNAFDANADGALEEFEIDQLLATYRRQDVPTRIVLEKLDSNHSLKLELSELTALSQLLSATYSEQDERAPTPEKGRSIDELFGGLVERESANFQRTMHPPQIGGPVRPFRRLDLDGNGSVSLEELERLQRPLTLNVRLAAVLAALDSDGDGGLSAYEFEDALN